MKRGFRQPPAVFGGSISIIVIVMLLCLLVVGRAKSSSAFVVIRQTSLSSALRISGNRSTARRQQFQLQSTLSSKNNNNNHVSAAPNPLAPTTTIPPKKQRQQQPPQPLLLHETPTTPSSSPPPLINLYTIDKHDLEEIIMSWGYPKYRANQVYTWVRDKGIVDVNEMKNVPQKLRDELSRFSTASSASSTSSSARTTTTTSTTTMSQTQRGRADDSLEYSSTTSTTGSGGGALEVVREQISPKDGTIKRLYRLRRDGLLIESVLMKYNDGRRTACISSQAGCAQGCVFCATGQMGFQRQLSSDEIVEQVTRFSTLLKQSTKAENGSNKKNQRQQDRLSNIVFMGEGEPMANFRNVMDAVPRIQELTGIGARKITISTVGIVKNIRKLMESPIQVRLAVSLHCASDEERTALLPANRRNGGLQELMTTLKDYIDTTGRRITLEWALIQGENDTPEVARQLGNLLKAYKLRRDMVHVNVIPLNPTGGYAGSASGKKRVDEFVRILEEEYRVSCTPRMRRGIDIDAGCGQLKSKELEATSASSSTSSASSCSSNVKGDNALATLAATSFSLDSTRTVDLDGDLILDNTLCDENGEIMDETFDSGEAARLVALVKGTTIKGA